MKNQFLALFLLCVSTVLAHQTPAKADSASTAVFRLETNFHPKGAIAWTLKKFRPDGYKNYSANVVFDLNSCSPAVQPLCANIEFITLRSEINLSADELRSLNFAKEWWSTYPASDIHSGLSLIPGKLSLKNPEFGITGGQAGYLELKTSGKKILLRIVRQSNGCTSIACIRYLAYFVTSNGEKPFDKIVVNFPKEGALSPKSLHFMYKGTQAASFTL